MPLLILNISIRLCCSNRGIIANLCNVDPVFIVLLIITNGSITGVRLNPTIGLTSLPNLSINTRTGYNAILKPVLRFVDPNDAGFVVPLGTPVLQVIDCVGKV